jgi:transcriptional regulator with XRE-family HTH domain
MAKSPTRTVHHFLFEARRALSMSQREFGYALGSSHRSAQRWAARQAEPAIAHFRRLAELLLPVDAALAHEAAVFGGQTLESFGLVAPVVPLAPSPASSLAPLDLVDIVVCAAADVIDVSPRALRPALLAAFRRARQIGLTLEQVEEALSPSREKGAAKSPK